TSLQDFVNRVPASAFNRKTLEALIKSGGFDSTGYTRKQLMYFVDETPLLESASKRQKDKAAGQISMFDMFAEDPDAGFTEDIPEPDGIEWDKKTLLTFEKEILKMYVSDHPLRPYENYLPRITKYSMAELNDRTSSTKTEVFAGMISEVSTKRTKRGTLMANFTLEDTTGSVECVCFDFEKNQNAVYEDAIVKIKGRFEVNDRGNQLLVNEVKLLELSENEANAAPLCLELTVKMSEFNAITSNKLINILKAHPGKDSIVLFVVQSDGSKMKAELPVQVNSKDSLLLAHLHDLFNRPIWKAS
ncbi:MAG: OB-fold nucleic acid binding domain-containing protein, partial [Anaerotardibacter sp.]